MRVIFMGTPDFSVPALRAIAARHQVVAVYSQPPRAAIQAWSCHVNGCASATREAVDGGSSHWRAQGSALCGRRAPSGPVISYL